MDGLSRRHFLAGAGAVSAVMGSPLRAWAAGSPFRIGVISDEISPDFDHACHVIANDFGLHYVELRALWGKSLKDLDDGQLAEARTILAKYKLTVTDIASPLFKVDWPGAPPSRYGSAKDMHGAAETTFSEQDQILERTIGLAKQFGTDKIRCFDFWRIDDVKPYREAINEKLRQAAAQCAKHNLMLVLENEFACNTATGRESGATLAGVQARNFALNWDPGNAVMRGELDAYPAGFAAIPVHRIHHCHVKNAVRKSDGQIGWSPVDVGYVDWAAQFRALKQAGYTDAVSLETHWEGGGSPEASTRTSWAGMRKRLQEADAI